MDSQEMPRDMIFEILTRTSLAVLDTCKAVSNTWKQLIHDPDFLFAYCSRTNCVSGYLIQTLQRNKYLSTIVQLGNYCKIKIGSEDGTMKLLASCNAGICCYERTAYKNNRYFACKPATQQWEPLPNPRLKHMTEGVGIVVFRCAPLRYKIVRLCSMSYRCATQYSCEVFDSETWGRWRWIHGVNLSSSSFNSEFIDILSQPGAVSIGESLHWLTNEDNVLKFNASKECFDKFSLPQEVDSTCRCKRLFECEGKLGFSCLVNDGKTIKLWLLRDNEWNRGKELDIASLGIVDFPTYVGFFTSQVLFINTLYDAFFYRLDQQLIVSTKVDLDYDFRYMDRVFQFRSDFEMVKLKGGQKPL